MKKILVFACGLGLLVGACSNPTQENGQRIEELNGLLRGASTTEEMIAFAQEQNGLILDQLANAQNMEDTTRYAMLIQGAKCGRALKEFDQSIGFYEELVRDFPEAEFTPKAYFLSGFIYENDLQDLGKADSLYSLVISKYPDNELADQARILKEQLGIPLEDIIRKFQEQNKELK
ncbi:MAG: tetratricopeptide (TPR) repeat protein [Luteibaculaceae bacterium]|jgi:tetratricopeptide (TPR) repeat protein